MAGKFSVSGLISKLKSWAKKAKPAQSTVVVGFTQSYATIVHENTEASHTVGQAKYLEQPARTRKKRIGEVIAQTYKATGEMEKSLVMGGMLLQRSAQELTPVDTGALRASAFTAPERTMVQVSEAAFRQSEAIRKRGKRKGRRKK